MSTAKRIIDVPGSADITVGMADNKADEDQHVLPFGKGLKQLSAATE